MYYQRISREASDAGEPKDNEFRCVANGRSIKVGVELSDTIASHKKLTLVVGMTMILDDFFRQWMLQKAIILF
jgi:hypothetical protein